MGQPVDSRGSVLCNGTAVLMARIVDRIGAAVRQTGIVSISYSICRLHPRRPNRLLAVAGHDDVALEVDEVIFDTLRTDDLWTIDKVGYNFRHVIDICRIDVFAHAGARYQVRYELTPAEGQKTFVRFQLRNIST